MATSAVAGVGGMVGNAVVTENIIKEARDLLSTIREDKRRQEEKLEEARDRSRNNRRRLNDNLERQRQLTESLNRKQALLAENREGIQCAMYFMSNISNPKQISPPPE